MSNKKEVISRVDGRARFLDVLFDVVGDSKQEVIMAMLYWGSRWGDKKLMDEVVFPRLEEVISQAMSNGSSIRVMGDTRYDTLGISKKLQDLGVKVRGLEGIPFRFAVVDMKRCLFAISEPYTETSDFYHAIFTNNKTLVQFFKDNFEILWPISHKIPK
jgi:hypothetical protein